MRPQFSRLLLILLLSAAASACGYRFQGSGSVLPADVQTVAVLPVGNNTTVTGIARDLEEALRTSFESYGVLRVVEQDERPDAVVKAKILKIDRNVKSVTGPSDVALEYDLVMTIAAELRRKNGQLLYTNPTLSAVETFASTSDVVVTSSSAFAQSGIDSSSLAGLESNELSRGAQRAALGDLVEEVARRLYLDAVASDF